MPNIIDNIDNIDIIDIASINNLENILDYNYHNNKNVDKTIYILYDLLVKADKYIKKKKKGKCFNYKLTKINMFHKYLSQKCTIVHFFQRKYKNI